MAKSVCGRAVKQHGMLRQHGMLCCYDCARLCVEYMHAFAYANVLEKHRCHC